MVDSLGANDDRVVEAAIAQLRDITHARPNFNTIPLLKLPAKLAEISPGDLTRIGYCLHGSLAVEMAFKNRSGARNVIVMQDSYNGRSLATMVASSPHPNNPFHALQPQCFTRVPHPDSYRPRFGTDIEAETRMCLNLMEDTITKGVGGGVAALIIEPILGNGGHIIAGKAFLQGLRDVCDHYNIVLIFDEIQSCFGRTGEMFAAEYYGVTPDIMTFGKGISGGFPLAGIMASDRLNGFASGEDALTFGQFRVAMAVVVATIDAIIADDLSGKARALGAYAMQRLREMSERHPLIGDIRGPGCSSQSSGSRIARPKKQRRKPVEKGVLFGESRCAGLGNRIKIKSPLVCSHAQMSQALDVFDAVLGRLVLSFFDGNSEAYNKLCVGGPNEFDLVQTDGFWPQLYFQEIYHHPNAPFVARFVGRATRFDGVSDGTTVNIPEHGYSFAPSAPVPTGRVSVFVKNERFVLGAADTPASPAK